MDAMQPAPGGKSFSRMAEEIILSIDGVRFRGFLREDDSEFSVTSEAGERLRAGVLETKCQSAERRFPLLSACGVIPDRDKARSYVYYREPSVRGMVPLREFLFGQRPLKIMEQILLGRSLAAAFAELETARELLPVCSFSLDAVFADPATLRVELSLSSLLSAEVDGADAERELLRDGLLPPEYCAGGVPFSVSPELLRHSLAVLVFRCLTREDPFDGETTLTEYPCRTDAALRRIYGYEAAYVAAPGNANPTGRMIGENVGAILSHIVDPALSAMFTAAFRTGISQPEARPSPIQWEATLRTMLDLLISANGSWWVLPPEQMIQNFSTIPCIRTAEGERIAFTENKPLFRCMLHGMSERTDEMLLGRFRIKNGRTYFADWDGNTVELTDAGCRIDDVDCVLCSAAEAFAFSGEGIGDV